MGACVSVPAQIHPLLKCLLSCLVISYSKLGTTQQLSIILFLITQLSKPSATVRDGLCPQSYVGTTKRKGKSKEEYHHFTLQIRKQGQGRKDNILKSEVRSELRSRKEKLLGCMIPVTYLSVCDCHPFWCGIHPIQHGKTLQNMHIASLSDLSFPQIVTHRLSARWQHSFSTTDSNMAS